MHTRKMLKKKYVCREFEDVFLGRGYVLNPCPSRFSHRALISQERNVRALQESDQNLQCSSSATSLRRCRNRKEATERMWQRGTKIGKNKQQSVYLTESLKSF